MFARQWQAPGSLEAKQLASEVNRGSLELAAQRLSLCLEDFKPNREVEGFLTTHESILSSLGELSNNVGEARGRIKELHKLRDDLRSLVADLSRKVRGVGAGAAGTQVSQDARGSGSGSVGDVRPEPCDAEGVDANVKTRRLLWYNWYFVACLISFAETLVPRSYGPKWRLTRAVEVVNELVNRAFVSCGASAFYILDTYSAMQYLLGASRDVQETAETVARMAFTNLSSEYHGIFPRDNAGPIFFPIPLIAEKTGCSGEAVCRAIGLGEVGSRCGGFLDGLRKDVMAVPGPLMSDLLRHHSTPLWLPSLAPSSTAYINQLPPNSFVMLASVRNLTEGR